MGQPITVTVRAGVRGDVMHFELNRSLTGMQTLHYTAAVPVTGIKPPDELARRLLALGPVSAVTIYSSVVTVVAPQDQWSALQPQVEDTITNLFIYYRDGQLPASPDAPAVPAATEATPAAGDTPATEEAPVTG